MSEEFPPKGEGGETTKKRTTRPAVQLYRPGMMKTGTDITKNVSGHTHKAKPPKTDIPVENDSQSKQGGHVVENVSSARRGNCGGRARGRGRAKGGGGGGSGGNSGGYPATEADRRSEAGSVSSNDDVRSEGGFPKKRGGRRRSSGGSSTSSTYRYESSSTICSRKNSRDGRKEDQSDALRRSNQRLLNNVKGFHSSSQSLSDRPSSMHYQNYATGEERSWRFNSKGPSKQDFRRADRYSSYREPRRNLDETSTLTPRRGDAFSSATDVNRIVFENSDINGFPKLDYAKSIRDESRRERRNWSFRSNRSERYDKRRRASRSNLGRERGDDEYYDDDELIDDHDNKSLKNRPSSPTQYKSFQDLCASFDSMSFNWSTEVEEEERRKKEREELARTEVENRLASTTNTLGDADSADRWQKKKKKFGKNGSRAEQATYGQKAHHDSGDQTASPRDADASGHRCMRYSQRMQRRNRNDSFTSQTSSVAESIEEGSDEGGSGERTPTYEDQAVDEGRIGSGVSEVQPSGHAESSAIGDAQRPSTIIGEECGQIERSLEQGGVSRPEVLDFVRCSNVVRRSRCQHTSGREPSRIEPACVGTEMNGSVDLTPTPATEIPLGVPLAQPPRPPPPAAMIAAYSRPPPPGVFVIDVSVPPPNLSVPPPSVNVPPPRLRLLTARPLINPDTQPVVVNTGVVWKKERGRKIDMPPTEWPIHMEIARREGPLIQELNDSMAALMQKITEDSDISAAEELLARSSALSELFTSIVTRDIHYTYAMNLEQHMWKQCFYKPIEVLRTASNSSSERSQMLRSILKRFLQQGLDFYAHLLNKYEVVFGFLIEDFLYWPSALPGDDFAACTCVGSGAHEFSDHSLKVAVMSAQRLAVSLGDLHRYNAMVCGVKDYSSSRGWYLKAAQLAPGSGRSYNQLALLAVYACKWVDVVFYYTRALAAHHAFETSRQPLFTAFNDMRKKIDEYEAQLDERLGMSSSQAEAEREAARAEKPYEIWITADGRRTEREHSGLVDCAVARLFENDSIVKLYRRTVPYLLHTAGLLITKIGMELFEQQSERALLQLTVLISKEECPLSAIQLVQIASLFLFAVHYSSSISLEANTCSLLQQRAVQMVLSIFGVLLRSIEEYAGSFSLILDGTLPIPSKMRRVLPSLWVLSEWLSTPSMNRIYKGMPSLGPIESSLVQIDVWQTFALIVNALVDAETQGKLSRSFPESKSGEGERIEIVLPESVFLASFVDVFPAMPKSIRLSQLSGVQLEHDGVMLALHARASAILSAAEYLDGSGLHCFAFDEKLHRFAATQTGSSGEHFESRRFASSVDNQVVQIATKERTDQERESIVIEVRPNYLVPDTNTFIDHLESIVRIVSSGKFTVLVPTTVTSELMSLSRPAVNRPAMGQLADEEQDNWVMERAKLAISYLQKAADQKMSHISTITTKGSRLPSVFLAAEQCNVSPEDKTVNDDMILSSCSALCATMPQPSSTDVSETRAKLFRNVVLLTDDRALHIKAVCANIPCRTIPSFIKWAAT
uniref:PIN domain-containing protein n=1 Tax=Parascaris univalens TaxID=6257 RepID=A0A915C3F4_PARUN